MTRFVLEQSAWDWPASLDAEAENQGLQSLTIMMVAFGTRGFIDNAVLERLFGSHVPHASSGLPQWSRFNTCIKMTEVGIEAWPT